jgi:shikimate 5-dehydrogenase
MQSRRLQGWIIADGLDVLIEQGIAQFEILTKRPAPSHVMRRTVREQYFIAQHAHASHESVELKSN